VWQIFVLLGMPSTGWDYRTYVSAVQAFGHSQDPYILENIIPYQLFGANLFFDYPPHTLYFFWMLDFFLLFHKIIIYDLLLFVLLAISAYLIAHIDENRHYLFLATLLLTGFMSTFWNFITGNSSILFLLLFAIMFTLLVKGKYWQSSIVMGFSAAFSLFTIPFIALFLMVKRPIIERLKLISISFSVVALLFVIDYVVNPSYLYSYISMMSGGNSPLLETGGWNQPTPYLMFKSIINGIFPDAVIPWIGVSCLYICLILYATWKYYLKNNENLLKIISLVTLSIFMVLPRTMPYNFIILVIPLYLLFKDSSYKIKTVVLAVITLPPLLVWLSQLFGIFGPGIPILSYAQAYSLILIFLVVILQDRQTPVSNANGKNSV